MASNPPFDDQTDNDFFDKLVDDDFGPTVLSSSATAVKFIDGNDSANARAFANRSIGEDSGGEDQMHKEEVMNESSALVSAVSTNALSEPSAVDNADPTFGEAKASNASNVSVSESNDMNELKNEGFALQEEAVSIPNSAGASMTNASLGSGAKEVGWSLFCADSSEDAGVGFASYSDFFAELENNVGDLPGQGADNVSGVDSASKNAHTKVVGSDTSFNYGHYHDGQVSSNSVDQNANGQDSDSNQNWENMYPGWKYDLNTGEWHQVENYDQRVDSQWGNGILAAGWGGVSDGTTDVANSRHSCQSVVGSVAEASTTECLSDWSQALQVNNGYPEHMVFDLQYPGWYYDTVAQEWHTLDSYNIASQSTGQVHDQQSQNGYASTGLICRNGFSSICGEDGRTNNHLSPDLGSQGKHGSSSESYTDCNKKNSGIWEPETVARTETITTHMRSSTSADVSNFVGNRQVEVFYGSSGSLNNLAPHKKPTIQSYDRASQGHWETNGTGGTKSFAPHVNFSMQFNAASAQQTGHMSFSNDVYGSHQPADVSQQSFQGTQQFPCAPSSGRSPDGRPPHVLVTFGFGGKLIVMKDITYHQNSSFGNQAPGGSFISVMNLMEAVSGSDNASSLGEGASDYFSALCQQSFPGPLTGGNVGSKDLNKWIDERIANHESPGTDHRKGELLKFMLSLLKIACQHYGKLRSPFGTDTMLRETDTPESAVAKLFASAKKSGTGYSVSSAFSQCLQHIPPEEQLQATASEVQNLLVSGRKMEALQYAQDGHLWGPALVIATQLGEQFYANTVNQMALHQLVVGTPLRTLCLLIAGQPAEVFSSYNTRDNSLSGSMNMSQQHTQFRSNSMLDDWEENLAVITANRTKDDELVITHLGDCLWKERSEIIAAHICYLVAEINAEPYSDTARLCLIGADHWKFPRTYASPEAIQRTELYEYSKVLGNAQYILLPFQPYRLIYAYMLAEVGKVSDALKYCQAVLKSLKTGRAPEVEALKQVALSLEERIRIHQQGGYTNLAPAKFVGKLLNFFDSTAQRVVGGLPPHAPTTSHESARVSEQGGQQVAPRVSASQSTMAMSSLMPSASMDPIGAWAGAGNRTIVHNRSVSEPDFGRAPRLDLVDSSKTEISSGVQGKESGLVASRLSHFGFGSQLLQKTVGLVLRPKSSRQAKLGETNKFYYDEKLKRWVEEGAEAPAEEATLPPPPTAAAFPNGMSDYGMKSTASETSSTDGSPGFNSPTPSDTSSGMPPIPSNSNQFSARGRMGVRARYVDTFNQGRANSISSFQSPSAPSVKPPVATNAKFFIPTPVPTDQQRKQVAAKSVQDENSAKVDDPSISTTMQPLQTPTSSTMTMQRFPSMDQITGSATMTNPNGPLQSPSRRTASWGGSFNSTSSPGNSEVHPLGEFLGMPPSSFMPTPANANGFRDELHEVQH